MRRVDTGPRPIVAHLDARPGFVRFVRWRARRAASRRALVALAFLATALAATVWPAFAPRSEAATRAVAVEWPTMLDGRPLRPLALGAVEQRFAERFPGAIGRFDDGRRAVILRHVTQPTRMLHPAADCFRGLGYAIRDERLEHGGDGRLHRCFVATRDGVRLRVCERIVGADGTTYTDASAWYWSVALGRSQGPWLATTTAEVT